jgi:RNA polymerase sigma-70 factor (ECF subfamily)
MVEELIARFGPMVFRRAKALLRDSEEARDVTQDVLIELVRCRATLDSQASSWLYRVTTNACLNRIRSHRRFAAFVERSARYSASDSSAASADDQYLVRRLLAECEPMSAAAAVYVYIEGMSHEEAAQLLEVSRRTIGNLLERFNVWARDALEEPYKYRLDSHQDRPGERQP